MSAEQERDGTESSIFDEDPDLAQERRERELRRIRSALITSGILIVLPTLIRHFQTRLFGGLTTLSFAASALILVGIYVALGTYAMRKPFTALLAGLTIYFLLQAVAIALAPAEPFTAWIFRILVVLNLVMPLQKARSLQRGVQ